MRLRFSVRAEAVFRFETTPQKKKALRLEGLFRFGSLALTYFRAVYLALSSALPRFTVLFGMGRRGSRALWAPDIARSFTARRMAAMKPVRRKKRVGIALKRDLGIFPRL